MRVRLLGPVEVAVDGGFRAVPGLRRAAVLAVLALHPQRVVSTERLVDIGWGGLDWFDAQARRLDDVLLHARRAIVETRLALGQHAALVAELEELSRQHPFDEHVHGQLIVALYRCGRQNDALARYPALAADPRP